jgi:hypothetical protein
MSVHFPNPLPTDLAAMDDEVRRMSGTLSCDFANGRVGERHNTFGHRTRLLRQLTARRGRIARAESGPPVRA